MNNKYFQSTIKIILILFGFLVGSELAIADERDTFDVLMTSEEKAEVEDAIETSKTMSSQSQEKLQQFLDGWKKLENKWPDLPTEVQVLINKANTAGLKSKIGATQDKLKQFDSGLQSIMDKKEKLDQVIGFYDRYRPDSENPFRSLEVMENLLTDLETLLPKEQEYEVFKNTTAFLIRTGIRYFKEAIQAAHGGLKNIQKSIKERAGNCLGYIGGDEYGDPSDPKRKAYEDMTTGDIICYTGVRPVGGEIWKNTPGDAVYVWSSGVWTKLDCGFGIANDVFKYWRLANDNVISADDLIYWCTGNYDEVFIKAAAKGGARFKEITAIDDCQEKILDILSLKRDLKDLIKSTRNNSEVFIAKYIFKKDGVRESADLITKIAKGIVLLEGVVEDSDGKRVSGATVSIEGSFETVSIDTDSRGRFEILAEIPKENQIGLRLKITVTADDYPDFKDETRLQSQCWNMGTFTMKGKAELIIKPKSSKIIQGETVNFSVLYTDSDGNSNDVTSSALKNSKFRGESVGTFSVSATYNDLSATATVKVIKKECKENEKLNTETYDCDCVDGYKKDENDICVPKDDEEEEDDEEETVDECSLEYIEALTFMLEVLVADTKLSETELISYINKFNKEINDQSSDPCNNSIIAYCYYSALEIAARMAENVSDIQDIAVEIIMLQAMCPDLSQQMQAEGITVKSLISSIAGLGSFKDKLSQMESRLHENGCDEDEVKEEGEKIVPPEGDPGFIQEGGISTEMPGDGDDNDGDGQQDEEVEGLSGYNITLVLYDSGSAADDIFNLSVGGYGSLGQTPAGGLRSYGLNLLPGSYTAVVTVVLAPDDVGTYTLTVLYDGESIGSITGAPPQGSSGTLTFTVPSE
ncbi:carboxypeptidase-like regulatory domain-containing protein [Candidatus Neomarinimicrobiota bacterium]